MPYLTCLDCEIKANVVCFWPQYHVAMSDIGSIQINSNCDFRLLIFFLLFIEPQKKTLLDSLTLNNNINYSVLITFMNKVLYGGKQATLKLIAS